MADNTYTVRRSRSGRFNFSLASDAGRIEGTVAVSTAGKTDEEIDREARDKIRGLAEAFFEAQSWAPAERLRASLAEIRQRDIKTW